MEERFGKEWALDIAALYGLQEEVKECIEAGLTPEQALREWDII